MAAIIRSFCNVLATLTVSVALGACAATPSDDIEDLSRTNDALLEQAWHSEAQVASDKAYAKVLSFFAKETVRGSFVSRIAAGDREIEISYAIARAQTPEEKGAIVVVNGRSETFEQYAELAYDLTRRGYTLYMLDHRGQGHSGRMIDYDKVGDSHYQKGTVDHFASYVADLHKFITTVVHPDRKGKPERALYGLGHSMGGTVLTLYGMTHPKVLTKIALSSPMHEIEVDLSGLAAIGFWWQLQFHPNDYAKKGAWTEAPPFAGNALTSSRPRFAAKQAIFEGDRSLRVGGPTHQWVKAALDATDRARDEADQIEVPVLLLRAGDDRVVEAGGQTKVCDRINAKRPGLCQLEVLKGSRHESLIEVDAIRTKSLDLIVSFLAK
jgi:lysophospholipase